MEEKQLLEDREPMERLSHKGKLIKDSELIFEFVEQRSKVLPWRMLRFIRKSLFKDFKKGMKIIEKRIPVFIELPQYEKEGNGMYSMNYVGEENQEDNKIIEVTPPVIQKDSPVIQ